jgi:hypothetical protein
VDDGIGDSDDEDLKEPSVEEDPARQTAAKNVKKRGREDTDLPNTDELDRREEGTPQPGPTKRTPQVRLFRPNF